MAGDAQPGKPVGKGGCVLVVIFMVVMVAVLCAATGLSGDGEITTVSPPAATDRNDTVADLRDAAERQSICYGWRLQQEDGDVVSVGSNLGDGVSAADDPRCPRWLQVTATVVYTAESSESEDSAVVTVKGSPGFDDDARDLTAGLSRFGLTEAAFVEEPGWAVTRAAVSLPLLVVETGAASPEPMVTTAPTEVPTPLPAAGSDLWRDRSGWLIGAAGLLLIAVLLVVVGLVQRRRGGAAVANGRGAGVTSRRKPGRV